MGPTGTSPVLDPLAVLPLNNRLYMCNTEWNISHTRWSKRALTKEREKKTERERYVHFAISKIVSAIHLVLLILIHCLTQKTISVSCHFRNKVLSRVLIFVQRRAVFHQIIIFLYFSGFRWPLLLLSPVSQYFILKQQWVLVSWMYSGY